MPFFGFGGLETLIRGAAIAQSNLEVLDWTLPSAEYDAISSIKFQRRLVDGTMVRPKPCPPAS